MKTLINTKLILEDGIVFDGVLNFDGGRIVSLGKRGETAIPAGSALIDAGGLYTSPGFVDIHNHGGPRALFHADPQTDCRHFLSHGVTSVLPTLYHDLPLTEILSAARILKEASQTGAGRIIRGIYMEGPYMGGFGSNQSSILWNGGIRRDDYLPLIAELRGFARIWAVDPARPGIGGFIRDVAAADPRAIFALGHSRATSEQCRALRRWNLRLQTHHGDSGKCPGRAQGTVGAGCDEFTLYSPDMYAELIADENGIHVDPDMLRTVYRIKGPEKIILISDSMPDVHGYKNNAAAGILYGPDLNYDSEGMLAGSHLTLDRAVRNMMAHTGCGICQAVRMASLNPARMLGDDTEYGSLEAGKRADLLLIDDTAAVKSVFLAGEEVSQDGELK
ncbi:MAG: amidohydrolase family protein [Clostridia bacterium]|nr:amidohydrolase family protein [Clostridia bacterium]